MAKYKEREKALALRKKGKSYSEIKKAVSVSKSTLSNWLREYPLSPKQLRAVRDLNPQRIEKYRNTMRAKREAKQHEAYKQVKKDIKHITDRELFIAGFFLYWAEGTKTATSTVSLSNTDPAVLMVFIKWLTLLGVKKEHLKARLHLYTDMDTQKETTFWSKKLGIPTARFTKPYIKKTQAGQRTHKGVFGHGTCNIIYGSRALENYIVAGIRLLREWYH